MRSYELMLVLRPDLEEEALEAVIEKATSTLTRLGSELSDVDRWGKRRLAYEIKDYTEGFYVVIGFTAESEATFEVERVLKITEEVLRYLLVRKDS